MNPVQRGVEAQEILNHPLVEEAFQLIEKSIQEMWESASETSMREELWRTLHSSRRFKNLFMTTIENGKFEKALMEKNNAQT